MPNPAQGALTSQKLMAFVATANAAKAKAFYSDTLGLRLIYEDNFAIAYDIQGVMLRVTKVEKATIAPYTVLGWQVDDAVATVKGLANAGVQFERYSFLEQDELGIWTAPGGAKIAWLKDPDGNVLSIAQL